MLALKASLVGSHLQAPSTKILQVWRAAEWKSTSFLPPPFPSLGMSQRETLSPILNILSATPGAWMEMHGRGR